jgi:hypothetical protein
MGLDRQHCSVPIRHDALLVCLRAGQKQTRRLAFRYQLQKRAPGAQRRRWLGDRKPTLRSGQHV